MRASPATPGRITRRRHRVSKDMMVVSCEVEKILQVRTGHLAIPTGDHAITELGMGDGLAGIEGMMPQDKGGIIHQGDEFLAGHSGRSSMVMGETRVSMRPSWHWG